MFTVEGVCHTNIPYDVVTRLEEDHLCSYNGINVGDCFPSHIYTLKIVQKSENSFFYPNTNMERTPSLFYSSLSAKFCLMLNPMLNQLLFYIRYSLALTNSRQVETRIMLPQIFTIEKGGVGGRSYEGKKKRKNLKSKATIFCAFICYFHESSFVQPQCCDIKYH